ncbi:hypothetical protein [Aureliella helgolandensis]|uniref:hypothetical protein n=1 Tax=Aureliella helgolandensis TaxID=2527968 RepID=UPI0011A9B511|nr:hypothetical protein [Aureliella helgolandensis]
MPKLITAVPKYRKHRRSGQAVVSINGRDHYLGPHGTKASKLEYAGLSTNGWSPVVIRPLDSPSMRPGESPLPTLSTDSASIARSGIVVMMAARPVPLRQSRRL